MVNCMKRPVSILGFTLIELLIVVAIIGILAAIAVPNFVNAQVRAKIAQTESNMRTLVTALESYRLDRNTYLMGYAYGGGSWNDYRSYNDLTTPIAYLTSTDLVNDPFRNEIEGSGGGDTYDQKFEYTPRKRGSNPANLFPAPSTDMYLVEGTGPDQVDSFSGSPNYPNPPSRWAVYNASNGLRSQGDIVRAGGVLIPEWLRPNLAW